MAANQGGQQTIRGVVVACELDDEGEALAVAIAATDGQQYLIDSGDKGAELLNFVDASIEVVGTLRRGEGELRLSVIDYQLVEEEPQDQDDDEDEDLA